MPDERARTEQRNLTELPPPADDQHGMEKAGPYERFISWAAGLPWWAIILGVFAVVVLYSMLTSIAYRRVIQFLTDDPQVSTNDLFNAVLIVGEDIEVAGAYQSETTDSVSSVLNQLLREEGNTQRLTEAGFIVGETAERLTIMTDDGALTVLKRDIISEERVEVEGRINVTLTYLASETVTGIVTEINDDRMVIRTVDEMKETFDPTRILSRETLDTVTCGEDAGLNCHEGEIVRFEREGELITGTLNTLSNTNMSVILPGGQSREIRTRDIEYYVVATLTRAVNAAAAARPLADGDTVRVGYYRGDGIAEQYLGDIMDRDSVTLPLTYNEGEVAVTLVGFDDVASLLAATDVGEIDGMIYIAPGPEHPAITAWVEDNPASDVVELAGFVCSKGCDIEVKLLDDEIAGRVLDESADAITIVTTEAHYLTVDREHVLEERKMEPGACALNNLRGCNAGIFLTLKVTFQAYALALVIGLIVGIMRVQTNPMTLGSKVMQTIFTSISTLYVEVVRGIPLLVILLYAGFVISPELRKGVLLFDLQWFGSSLPDFRIRPSVSLGDEQEAIMGLAFGYGAFIAEIFRAGIQSISRGQMEAARSLGMSYPQAMRYVVLPQAIRVVLPPLGNDFIAMLKDSALISVLALPDLLQLGRLYVSRTFRAFEGYNTVAVLYLLMTLFLSMLVRIIERRSRLPG